MYLEIFLQDISWKNLLKLCDKLIVDSHYAKQEIINLLNLNKKIFVVYLVLIKNI